MTTDVQKAASDPTADGTARRAPRRRGPRMGWRSALSPLNISALYLAAVLLVIFTLRIPDLFWSSTTLKSILSEEAITAILALALLVPLAAGAFDLSVGPVLGVSGIFISWLVINHDVNWVLACLLGLGFGLVVGALNGLMVVRLKIHSFIATLATTSILAGLAGLITRDVDISVPSSQPLRSVSTGEWLGIAKPAWYMLAVALLLWYVLEHTPVGRYLFATGGGPAAARLAGVQTNRYIFGALVTSGFVAAIAGIIALSRIGASSSSTGPGYVLPAFAAAFVGATQFKRGQFNVWGTLVAVFVLAIGVKGLLLMQFDNYVRDLFDGVALALAVGLANYQSRPKAAAASPTAAETTPAPPEPRSEHQ